MSIHETLVACAVQFTLYAEHHQNKVPPDLEKVEINRAFAQRCRDALHCLDAIATEISYPDIPYPDQTK